LAARPFDLTPIANRQSAITIYRLFLGIRHLASGIWYPVSGIRPLASISTR
jgi:hypothetical protein